MSTTTIRLPDELKARLARLADLGGTTPHNFIVQALSERVAAEEARAEFHRVAHDRWAEFKRSSQVVSAAAMNAYVQGLAAGQNVARPKSRKLRP